jgi:LAO/AO transport system kinase
MENLPVDTDVLCHELLGGSRVALSRAITISESTLASDKGLTNTILEKIFPHTGNSLRIGITGSPGAGKSTFIDSFGSLLTSLGKKVAVLAVDPSSPVSGGSILGDKTRMEKLSKDENAFIRPSPSSGSLGGVTRKTRETMLLCEAAGFDVILIETVGVGQSETSVRSMVDFFLLLMLPGSGDELQGIKKGIMEMADAVVINKADGTSLEKAKRARAEFSAALHLFMPSHSGWATRVLSCSAVENTGIPEVWKTVEEFFSLVSQNGWFESNRKEQLVSWLEDASHPVCRNGLKIILPTRMKWRNSVAVCAKERSFLRLALKFS